MSARETRKPGYMRVQRQGSLVDGSCVHLPFASIDQTEEGVKRCTGATSHAEAGFTEQCIGKIMLCALPVSHGEEASCMVLFADASVTTGTMLHGLRVAETKQTFWQVDQLHADFGCLVVAYA